MDRIEKKVESQLHDYSEECTSVLTRFIDLYEKENRDDDLQLECICEVFKNYSMSLTLLGLPDMSNYGRVLNDADEEFMREPKFLGKVDRSSIFLELEKYIVENDLNEDESDAYERITFPMIPQWLSKCWQEANKIRKTEYNLYYFSHRYPHDSAINLLNNNKLSIEHIAKQC